MLLAGWAWVRPSPAGRSPAFESSATALAAAGVPPGQAPPTPRRATPSRGTTASRRRGPAQIGGPRGPGEETGPVAEVDPDDRHPALSAACSQRNHLVGDHSMEIVNEVTAHLENKPGRLAKICSALAQKWTSAPPYTR